MTNSKYGKSAIIENFQPMPKRFMVWDKRLNKFYEDSNGIVSGGGIGWLTEFLNICGIPQELLEIVQSTNLFDKDGNEIFEGSILEDFDEHILVVENKNGCFYGRQLNGKKFPLYNRWFADTNHVWNYEPPKLVGHILSNPELMEEKKNV